MSGEQGWPTSGPAIPPLGQLAASVGLYAFDPGGRYACPIEPCDWYAEVPSPTVHGSISAPGQPIEVTYEGVQRSEVEREVRAHLDGHDVEDWLFTVHHVRGDVANLEEQCGAIDAERARLAARVAELEHAERLRKAQFQGTWPGPAWAEDSAPPLQARRATARRDRRPLWRRLGFDSDRED